MFVCKKCEINVGEVDTLKVDDNHFCPQCKEWLNVIEVNGKLGRMQLFRVEPNVYSKYRGKTYNQAVKLNKGGK